MPAIITHYLCAKSCADALVDNGVSDSVSRNSDAFYLGAMGPDILFFSFGNKEVNRLGERMHMEGINNFYAKCVDRLRRTAIHEGRGEIAAYMAGFMCHYALDTCARPYIYYKTGFTDQDWRVWNEAAARRHFLETAIDCILSKKLEDKNPYLMNIAEKITVGPKKRALIAQFLADMINESYGAPLYPEDYIKAMKGAAFFYRATRDKTGVKKKALKNLGKLIPIVDAAAEMVHYWPVKRLDYLNEQRAAWHYPWDNAIELNFSFMDLYYRAVEDSRIYINAFMKAVNKQLDDKIALSILGDKNFSTGLESPIEFLYYNIGFNKILKE